MCFRPADASADASSSKCPECGQDIQVLSGVALKRCPHCRCDLVPYLKGEKAGSRSPGCPEAACLPLGPEGPQRPEGLSGAIVSGTAPFPSCPRAASNAT